MCSLYVYRLAFTIHMNDKPIDIVCDNIDQVHIWFLGLQSLAPLSTSYLSLAMLYIKRVRMKVRHLAKINKLNAMDVLKRIVLHAEYELHNNIKPQPVYSFNTPSNVLMNPLPQ